MDQKNCATSFWKWESSSAGDKFANGASEKIVTDTMLKVHLYVGPFTSVGTLLSWAPYLPGALSLQDGRFTIGPFTIIWSPLTPVSPLPRWGGLGGGLRRLWLLLLLLLLRLPPPLLLLGLLLTLFSEYDWWKLPVVGIRTFETACLVETAGTIAFSLRYSRRRTAACRYLRVTLSAASDFDEVTADDDGSGPVNNPWRRCPPPPPHWWKYSRRSSAFSIVRFNRATLMTNYWFTVADLQKSDAVTAGTTDLSRHRKTNSYFS